MDHLQRDAEQDQGGNMAQSLAVAKGKDVKKILDSIGDVFFFPQPVTSQDLKIYEPEEFKNEEYEVDFTP